METKNHNSFDHLINDKNDKEFKGLKETLESLLKPQTKVRKNKPLNMDKIIKLFEYKIFKK